MRAKRNTYMLLMVKPKGKTPVETPSSRWVDNIKIGLRDVECVGMDWIDLEQDREKWRAILNTVVNFRVR
jgi:hypothetical protein